MQGTVIRTFLLNHQCEQVPCKLTIRPSELVVTSSGIPDIHIAMERINTVMFEDKSTPKMSMAGFGIDYVDHGPARLMFFNTGLFPVRKTRKTVEAIQTAHREWVKGSAVDALQVIDVNATKKRTANSVIHRTI